MIKKITVIVLLLSYVIIGMIGYSIGWDRYEVVRVNPRKNFGNLWGVKSDKTLLEQCLNWEEWMKNVKCESQCVSESYKNFEDENKAMGRQRFKEKNPTYIDVILENATGKFMLDAASFQVLNSEIETGTVIIHTNYDEEGDEDNNEKIN